MPPFERDSNRIVIAGASSLLGAELKSLLEESRFAGWDLRLVDEEVAAGKLTEAAGEPAVIQPVEEGSFEKARFVFFTGSPQFTRANLLAAHQANATIIDLSGWMAEYPPKHPAAAEWFLGLNMLRGVETPQDTAIYAIPSAAAIAVSALALALAPVGLKRLVVTCFQLFQRQDELGSKNWKAKRRSYSHFKTWASLCLIPR